MVAVDEALQLVFDATPRSLGTETVELSLALNAVAATDMVCMVNLPPFDASVVDGFAIAEQLPPGSKAAAAVPEDDLSGKDLRVIAATAAGAAGEAHSLAPGALEAVYVTTGAPLPRGTTRVVPIETCAAGTTPGTVRVGSRDAERGATWIRPAGSDVASGKVRGRSDSCRQLRGAARRQ